MPRSNYKDAITEAVGYINSLPALENLGESAIKQGVVLRMLSAAGWDTFNLDEVQPEYRSGNTRVDFALMSPTSARSRTPANPLALVEVKSASENLESDRYERQMIAHCARNNVPLGVLTNGLKWLLIFWSQDAEYKENRFCEIDLGGDAESAADEINRYLARDRVSSGQAARSAERTLHEKNRDDVTRRAVLEGWRQVVRGLDEGLVELVATAAEQREGDRPENRFVRRVLMEHRSELLPNADEDNIASRPGSGSSRRRPASFSFLTETHTAASWPDLLIGVCELMWQRHPDQFEKILEIRGRSLPYFSRNQDDVHLPRQIGDSGIYASCQGAGVLIEGRAKRVIESFGYSGELLSVQIR